MRWVKRIAVFLVIVVLAGAAYGVFTVRRSFPQVSGELGVAGLDGEVEVLRDSLGVPHVYASTQHDLFFAQGYTHAQDRFWQMDFWRHIGSGRLAEMFGEGQVETDMFLRSLGFEDIAEAEWAAMGSPAREILQAYADGVNAYLADNAGAEVSLEYAILALQNSGYEIEPWSPTDTLMWPKVMAWDLGANMDAEIDRAILGRHIDPDRVEQLYPPMPEDKPVIVETDASASGDEPSSLSLPDGAIDALIEAADGRGRVMAVTGGGFEGIGSNNWVAGGSMTASGLPLLANDTHLANQMPSIWYANGLHCVEPSPECGFDVVGFSFPGTPTVVIGHNGHHAWGVTNLAADTQDLFVERVDPDDPGRYELGGEMVEFDTRSETIVVAGGEDVNYEVRTTVHGPVISGTYVEADVFDDSTTAAVPDDYVVSMAWKALEPSSIIDAFIGINLAESQEEFASAVVSWDIAPQNLVYADVEGNIGYFATGELPVRASGDGRYPVPGWTGEFDWVGVVAQEEMPRLLNPPQGFVQSANQAVLRPGSSPFMSADSALGYRADRIVDLLEGNEAHDVTSMQQMQMDSRDGGAEVVIPYLLAIEPGNDAALGAVQTRLEGWSTGANALQASGRSAGAAVYMAVWRQILARTFHDELPEEQWPTGGSRWFEVMRDLLDSPDDPWWDDVTTPATENRDD
ncbi:MAG TPA: penicillin acylase family protein, partial [Acidimicrobiia bacterium]|nr:penicillin acylase family protein [Acidimicrobiia bacterium]